MDRQIFHDRLHQAAITARDFARTFVEESLERGGARGRAGIR